MLHWAHATDPGDLERPMDQRLGVLGRSRWYGSSNASARPPAAEPRPPLAATRIRKLERVGWAPPGPRHRSRPPGFGRSNLNASAGARRALATGCCYPDTDSQLRRMVPAGPRPPFAATQRTKPGGLVTIDHGPSNPYPDGSPDSWLVPYWTRPRPAATRHTVTMH